MVFAADNAHLRSSLEGGASLGDTLIERSPQGKALWSPYSPRPPGTGSLGDRYSLPQLESGGPECLGSDLLRKGWG